MNRHAGLPALATPAEYPPNASIEVKVITPSPPNWMENRMTNWPNIDQYSPVFTTGMPQVDRAETAVKNDTGKLLKPS